MYNYFCIGANYSEISEFVTYVQNPPELDAPIFTTDAEKEDKVVDPEMQDLQQNVF